MKKYVMLILLLISLMLLTFNLNNTKEENNKEISKVEKILSKPAGITAYTLNGEKTDLSYNDLISGYEIDSIACKNGTIATYNNEDNSVSLSNIHMPDYCTMDFKEKPLITLYDQILEDNPTISERTDFKTAFTTTNTGTLYKTTEKNVHNTSDTTVYYFAGDAKNNWVKFGGYYWRIIRTNADGSIRLLYSGTRVDTTQGYIGESAFNSTYKDPMYVGYMYGTSGTLASNRTNENDSTIKTYIDNWYSTNLSSYTKYISTEAVYCNDRQLDSGQTWSASSSFNYITYTRLDYATDGAKANPTYDCADSHDAFSGSNADAKLTYPIGLMTADEINIAGGLAFNNAPAYYYLNSAGGSVTGSTYWWSLSPLIWGGYSFVWYVRGSDGPGRLIGGNVRDEGGVRPAISLKTCALWTSGDGTPDAPYEISTTSGC